MVYLCRAVVAGLLAVAVLAGPGACRPARPGRPAGKADFIAVVGAGRTDPLWPVWQGAVGRFQERTPQIQVRAEAPRVVSPNLQLQLIRRLRQEGGRGFCVQVRDPLALTGELEALRATGAVVVTMMLPVESGEPFLHAGIDPGTVGAALADALAQQTSGRGTLGVVYDDQDPVCRLRRQGFQRQIARYPRLVVLREFDCRGDTTTAARLVRQAMERFPGIDGWAAMDTWPVDFPDAGRPLLPRACALVVPGPLPDYAHQITTGRCRVLIVADYDAIVTRALEMCLTALNREIVNLRVYEAPPRWVTWETLPEFRRDWATWTGAQEEWPVTPPP